MILALKTADTFTQVRIVDAAGQPVANLEWESGRQLSDHLLGRLRDFVQEHQLALADLDGFIIFSGPGSFTSLRIGHAVLNALADGLGRPIVGTSGEDWLAGGQKALKTAKSGIPVLPAYGADAHITKRKP